MSGVVTEYKGIKYSLRPHGLRSRIFVSFGAFVLSFGGALAVMTPVEAAPGDCFIELPVPSPAPSPSPSSLLSPTPCSVAQPTVTVTKVQTKVVYVTQTVIVTPTPTPRSVASSTPESPQATFVPVPRAPREGSSGVGGLLVWGAGSIVVALLAVVAIGFVRSRRYRGSHHASDRDDEYAITEDEPTGRDYYDHHDLGGYAGETYGQQSLEQTFVDGPPGDADTQVIPSVR